MKFNLKLLILIVIGILAIGYFKPFGFSFITSQPPNYAPVYLNVPDFTKVNSPVTLQLISQLKFSDNIGDQNKQRIHAVYLDDDIQPACRFSYVNNIAGSSDTPAYLHSCIIPAERFSQPGTHKIKVVYMAGNKYIESCLQGGQDVYNEFISNNGRISNFAQECLYISPTNSYGFTPNTRVWNPSTIDDASLRSFAQQTDGNLGIGEGNAIIIGQINVLSETQYQTINQTITVTKYVEKPVFSFGGFWQYLQDIFKKIFGG